MKIRVVGITDRGTPQKERLHISVLAETSLVRYVIFDSSRILNGTAVAAIPKHAYWFTDYLAKPGDNVVVYTGIGLNTKQVRPDGGTDHFFYWGLKTVLWHDPNACAVVLEVGDWVTAF